MSSLQGCKLLWDGTMRRKSSRQLDCRVVVVQLALVELEAGTLESLGETGAH